MYRFIALLIFLYSCTIGVPAQACECNWEGPFLSVAKKAKSVVLARIIGYSEKEGSIYRSMEIDVLETFSGEKATGRIRIWGDNGVLCRPYVTQFPIGTTWILALDAPNKRLEDEDGHILSGCGAYWLEVIGETVRGQIEAAQHPNQQQTEETSLPQFRTRIAAHVQKERGP